MSLPGFHRFKRDIVVLISFLILFVSISFLVNIGKKCPFRGSVLTGDETGCRGYKNNFMVKSA